MTPEALRREILSDLGSFTHDPLGFVLWAFPWGREGGGLANESGPDEWQRDQLVMIGKSLAADPFKMIRDATASGHSIGKTSLVCWIVLWALMTHEDTRGVVTANTDTQLRSKTWAELSKWYRLLNFECLREMFELEATSIHSTEKGHDRSWRIDALPWSERNTEAFAGLHNAGRRTLIIFDEASAIIDPIWDIASGALLDAETESIFLAYGNPTKNTGRFKQVIAGRFRSDWTHRQIDSRTVKRTNKDEIARMVALYGDDSDFVRVRICGQFPRAGTMQFISSEAVRLARARIVEPLENHPVIMGVDCARYGDDDSVMAIRRGPDARSIPWRRWKGIDAMALAGEIAQEAKRWGVDMIFIDAGNIGAAIIDRLRQLGFANVVEVWFGGAGKQVDWTTNLRVATANKRAEIWCRMRAWLDGGALPDDDMLEADLIGPEYGYAADQVSIQLEAKRSMKARGLASPDAADALACTFAFPVAPRATALGGYGPVRLHNLAWGTPTGRRAPEGEPDVYADLYR